MSMRCLCEHGEVRGSCTACKDKDVAVTLRSQLAAAERERVRVPELEGEVARLRSLLDRDRTGLAAALDECRKRARGGRWISEGRGSYEWDDDRYRKETGKLVDDIVSLVDEALHASGALANEAFHPLPGPVDLRFAAAEARAVVLSDEERAKGFVRPVRRSYIHVGPPAPPYPTRDLTAEETERFKRYGYVKYMAYPEGSPELASGVEGRFYTQDGLDRAGKGCGAKTTMGQTLAETYARDPEFYGATFCCACDRHFPVGAAGEFVWDGTNERVGT